MFNFKCKIDIIFNFSLIFNNLFLKNIFLLKKTCEKIYYLFNINNN